MNHAFEATLHAAPTSYRIGGCARGFEDDDKDAYLNPAIQGVNIAVRLPSGAVVRAVVAVDVLKTHFGAGDSTAEWVEVSRRHAGLLQWLALLQYEEAGVLPLVLTCKTVEQQLRGERSRTQAQAEREPERNIGSRQVELASAPTRLIV
jgi:hypothetical protein